MRYEITEDVNECGVGEYQVSDVHADGSRTHSYDFETLAEAEECLEELNKINITTKGNNKMRNLIIAAIIGGLLIISGTVKAGNWEQKSTHIDRLTGVEVVDTTLSKSSGGFKLVLRDRKVSDGRVGKSFFLVTDRYMALEKVNMKIVGGDGGNWISWDIWEVNTVIDGGKVSQTVWVDGSQEVNSLIKPFADKLKKAHSKGNVEFFIRVTTSQGWIDFDYKLRARDEMLKFFN